MARVAGALCLLSLLPAATLPPLAYDVLEYHLEAPRLFLADRSLDGDPHNFFTRLPMEAEVLYAAVHALVPPTPEDDRAAKWLAAGWIILFAWGCGVLAGRLGARTAGRWGAIALGAALPLSGKVALDAFSDGPTAVFAQLMVFGVLGLISQSGGPRGNRSLLDLLAAAAGAGFALSCKWGVALHVILPALLIVVLFGARAAGISLGVRRALGIGAIGAAVFSVWTLRAWIVTGNPVFPWAAGLFPSSQWSSQQEEFLVSTHRPLRPWEGAYWVKVWSGTSLGTPTARIPLAPKGKLDEGPRPPLDLPVGLAIALAGLFVSRRRGRFLAACSLGVLGILAWALVGQAPDRFLFPVAAVLIPTTAVAPCRLLRFAGGRRAVRLAAWGTVAILAAVSVDTLARRAALYIHGGYLAALTDPTVAEQAREEVLGRAIVTLQGQAEAARLRTGGRALILYEARGLLFPLPHTLNTVFDRSALLDLAGDADTSATIEQALVDKGFRYIIINEYELDRLVRFYPPLGRGKPIPPREALAKSPDEPYPLMDLYRPYASDARYAARREAIRAWHRSLVARARWRVVGPTGLVISLTEIGE